MTLYVRNTTRQSFEVNERLPEMGRVYTLALHPKRTVEIKNLNSEQLDRLIAHFDANGFMNRKNMHGRIEDYSGVIYSLDRPINDDEVVSGYNAVTDRAQDRAVKEATRAAISGGATQVNVHGARNAEIEVAQEHDTPGSSKGKPGRIKMRVAVDAGMSPGESSRLEI